MYIKVPLSLPSDKDPVSAIREDRLRWLALSNMMSKIAEADLLLVQGAVLTAPSAVFRGLNRPLRVPEDPDWYDSERVLVSVTSPGFGAEMIGRSARRCSPPPHSVFVAYLRCVYDAGQRRQILTKVGANSDPVYIVCHWEWVLCERSAPTLPEDHEKRFRERLA